MTQNSSSRKKSELALYSGCCQCLGFLSELTAIHTAIDEPERSVPENDSDVSLRLRKAYFHITAVLCWPIDTLIVHVMGPDIRTAQRHLDPIVSEFLHDASSGEGPDAERRSRKASTSLLGAVCHPTPQILIHSRHVGGLAPQDPIPCLAALLVMLAALVVNYCTALQALAARMAIGNLPVLADVQLRIQDMMVSVSAKDFLKALDEDDPLED